MEVAVEVTTRLGSTGVELFIIMAFIITGLLSPFVVTLLEIVDVVTGRVIEQLFDVLLWGTADEEKDEDCESEDETTSWSEVTSDDEINDWLMSRFVALSIDDDGGDMNIVLSFIVSGPDASSSINDAFN